MMVKSELDKLGLKYLSVEFGEVEIEEDISYRPFIRLKVH